MEDPKMTRKDFDIGKSLKLLGQCDIHSLLDLVQECVDILLLTQLEKNNTRNLKNLSIFFFLRFLLFFDFSLTVSTISSIK